MEEENDIVINNYNHFGNVISSKIPDVIENISKLPIEEEVKVKAHEIYYRLPNNGKNVKSKQKFQLIFYCVWTAYLELGYPQDPCFLGNIIGIKKNDIDKAFNKYSEKPLLIINPEDMVELYIKKINSYLDDKKFNEQVVVEEVKKILQQIRKTKAGEEWIMNTPVKIVSIVAIYFYLNDIKQSKYIEDISIIEKTCLLSWACIKRYHEILEKYYNMESEEKIQPVIISYL
ncbi:MAG: hypothetical protein QW478_01435 [Candidatus Micrarchaeaceae archaeon]